MSIFKNLLFPDSKIIMSIPKGTFTDVEIESIINFIINNLKDKDEKEFAISQKVS